MQIRKAMRMIEDPSEYLNCLAVHKQIVLSLEVYERRGEYDGTLGTAIECLKLAGYLVGA